jgi:hypothetical protein
MFVLMTVLALSSARFALFWAIVMTPIWAVWIEQAKPRHLFDWPGDCVVGKLIVVASAVIGIILVVILPPLIRPSIIDRRLVPLRGLAHLKSVLPKGRIYNTREYGGPLTFFGYPDWLVALDGRLYLYDGATWKEYVDAAQGKVLIEELVCRHQPDAFFLNTGFHQEFIEKLRQSRAWSEVYHDSQCAVFLPLGQVSAPNK